MRQEDRKLLERRVGESIVVRYADTNPPTDDAPDVIKRLMSDAGLPLPNEELDLEWLRNYPGHTVEGPLERASDDQLQAAYQSLYGADWVECPERWQPGYFRLFATHISADHVLVSEVRTALQRYGIDTFVAHVDIEPTEEWQAAIEQALKTCHTLAAFLTPTFHDSLWTDQEVGFVYGRGVLVLSLMLGRAPYGFLYKTQGLPVAGQTPEQIADRILDTLLKKPALNDALAEGLLTALEASGSYGEANDCIKTLRGIARWPRHLVEPLRAANAFNNQVDGAYDVPAGVVDLLGRVP